MPEGPEVETVARHIRALVVGRAITGARALWPASIQSNCQIFFASDGKKIIEQITRKGKYLLFKATSGVFWVHLRMSGKLFLQQHDQPLDPYVRAYINLDNGMQLRLIDPRKFARIGLLDALRPLNVGADFINGEVSAIDFLQAMSRFKGAIKAKLLAQVPFAGVGNIYADEALWLSKLHPNQAMNKISKAQYQQLHCAIIEVLEKGVLNSGTSLGSAKSNFVSALLQKSSNQNSLAVYGKAGQKCGRCQCLIQKIKVASRGTYFCPTCQIESL